MIVLDAYAVLAFLQGEPAAGRVGSLVSNGNDAVLTVLGVAEVIDHLVRLVATDEEEAVLDIAQLGLLAARPVEEAVAVRAGILRARHYHRRDRAVSLADCVVAATAEGAGAAVAASDPHLLDMCHAEGIDVLPLPDTHGRTWSP